MTHINKHTKKTLARALVGVFVVGLSVAGVFGYAQFTHAQKSSSPTIGATTAAAAAVKVACPRNISPGTAPGCPATTVKEVAEETGDRSIMPALRMAMITALLNVTQFVTDRLAYEAAVFVATGDAGQTPLFNPETASDAWGKLGQDVAGQTVGELSDVLNNTLNVEFDLCAPTNPLISLGLQLGIRQQYQPQAPKCDFDQIGKNWLEFYNTNIAVFDVFSEEGRSRFGQAALSKLSETLAPGRNELSASIRLNVRVNEKVQEAKTTQFLERVENDYKPVKDFITGNVKTPASTLQDSFQQRLKDANGDQTKIDAAELGAFGDAAAQLGITAMSTFTNTLLSTLLSRVYDGLFNVEPENADPFDLEGLAQLDREGAEDQFEGLLAATPFGVTQYSLLNEFAVCPVQGVVNRGLNNCVIDTNFLSAVSRGSSGQPLTVQEALDEGLLDGNRPLISPEDLASNQDPFCYSYGYCYGNLVKLRKARILPIGWELAALRNSKSNPKTLQEIVDEFDNCNENGTLDGGHPFCHLIDPDWVIRYPDTQCHATVSGELRLTNLSNGRSSVCADVTSCIGEDNNGNCSDGFGYCVREKNVWRFRGEACPAQYATCLAFENTKTKENKALLLNTVDFSVCGQGNAGCRWHKTTKLFDDKGNQDPTDDTYEFILPGQQYVAADRENDYKFQKADGTTQARANYSGQKASYSYEERIYLTHKTEKCDASNAGCTRLLPASSTTLNYIRNGGFEVDEDSDGFADYWNKTGFNSYEFVSGGAGTGLNALRFDSGVVQSSIEQIVPVRAGQFYTFQMQGKSAVNAAKQFTASLKMVDENGAQVAIGGLSFSGDCSAGGTYVIQKSAPADAWKDYSCTFSVPVGATSIVLSVQGVKDAMVDSFSLQIGEATVTFADGYSSAEAVAKHIKIPPSYLGCTGAATDPVQCKNYAQMCSPQDVGCNLYTPEDGDPSVPAVVSTLDVCPGECVGYASFKQEKTRYDVAKFPLHFIPGKATSCSNAYVGCDGFTNLDTVAEGGEGKEYYTYLRACLTPEMADGSQNKKSATFFTWEGSDNAGYQLKTWNLLESNTAKATLTFPLAAGGNHVESAAGLAPCTNWKLTDGDTVVCNDDGLNSDGQNHLQVLVKNEACNQRADIFTNPDCREFFDSAGNVHYRLFSQTITIDQQCAPYRKIESSKTSCDATGGFWTQQGFCRYFGFTSESNSCPAEQSGCRAYTGGGGRNATTVLNEAFESGDYSKFETWGGIVGVNAGLTISNESTANDGHSIRVVTGNQKSGFQTLQAYLDPNNVSFTYDAANGAVTCTAKGHTISTSGCDIDLANDGVVDCSVEDGKSSCGTLVGSLVSGKTFMLEFWAKGEGNVYTGFRQTKSGQQDRDFVDPTNATSTYSQFQGVPLTGGWDVYRFGPIDTSLAKYANFDENAKLLIFGDANKTFFVDNIVLKQVEDNIAIIKDSWVVPSTCDTAPNGVSTPQYYLGCEAYTDQNNNSVNLYQFSRLCSENVVGCQGFYNTANSTSPYDEVDNARCVYDTNNDVLSTENVAQNTDCVIGGKTMCTIIVGQSFCTFDSDRIIPDPLPVDGNFRIVYGPETVITPADLPVYLIDDGTNTCSESVAGCMEVGTPKFSQDLSVVTGFDSKHIINKPASYDEILCDNDALFCEEWKSTKDGNFYFKDPLNKACEYKTGVKINKTEYKGWFRKGTSDPCYYTDDNGDKKFTIADDTPFLTSGDTFSIWKNGDTGYQGWGALCQKSHDLCAEFIDKVDTDGGVATNGTSYYFKNNDALKDKTITTGVKCEGKTSQKEGCALFHNTTEAELLFNTSASYTLSIHADKLLNQEPNSLVDPVNCSVTNSAEYTLSAASVKIVNDASAQNVSDSNAALDGTQVNLCQRRCNYESPANDPFVSKTLNVYSTVNGVQFADGGSCLTDRDCSPLNSKLGKKVEGTCLTLPAAQSARALTNDANRVIKVNRDRSCSAWLTCESSRTSWNTRTNQYEQVCDSVNLCTKGTTLGDSAVCQRWEPRKPEILTDLAYSKRDVNWSGQEFSGYAIPNQLPVESYTQFNLSPERWCSKKTNPKVPFAPGANGGEGKIVQCQDATDCGCANANDPACQLDCTKATPDSRLVYDAGPCDSSANGLGTGGSCQVGFCSATNAACSSNADCAGNGNSCVIGYCQASAASGGANGDGSCTQNSDCNGAFALVDPNNPNSQKVNANVCDTQNNVCVDALTPNNSTCVNNASCGAAQVCVPAATTANGACHNNRCLTDIVDINNDGSADKLNVAAAGALSCRGYPEIDSPFQAKVVESWQNIGGTDSNNDGYPDTNLTISAGDSGPSSTYGQIATPYEFKSGYAGSTVCQPVKKVDANGTVTWTVTDDCVCNYNKAIYGKGAINAYHSISSPRSDMLPGICISGGLYEGVGCTTDKDCQAPNAAADDPKGTCSLLDRVESHIGWDGFCIERDTSINLYGSPEAADRACLTWLPVDQLTGSTDLFAKYTSAGYKPLDTHYCAEVDGVYDLTSSGTGCAEVQGAGACDNDISDDGPQKAMHCPVGYYAVAGKCGKGICEEFWGDNDYPFLCVPKLSYKTEDDNAAGANRPKGSPCLPPDQITNKNWHTTTHQTPNGITAYFVNDFKEVRKLYDDCTVRGVLANQGLQSFLGGQTIGDATDNCEGGLSGCRDMSWGGSFPSYAACTSVIKVGSSSLVDGAHYNVAWTDRVWAGQSDANQYKINVGSNDPTEIARFGFVTKTIDAVFGKAKDLAKKGTKSNTLVDPFPHRIIMCEKGGDHQLPNAVGAQACPNGYDLSISLHDTVETGEDARSYQPISRTPPTGAIPADCQPGSGCICDPTVANAVAVCNWSAGTPGNLPVCGGATCSGGTADGAACLHPTADNGASTDACVNGGGTCGGGTCNGGPLNGQGCSNDAMCLKNECVQIHPAIGTIGQCFSKQSAGSASFAKSGNGNEAAVARLRQIFARGFELHRFKDGYPAAMSTNGAPLNPGSMTSVLNGTLGSWEVADNNLGSWLWDVRVTGDGVEKPTVPVVKSLGGCIGTKCKEGKAGKFTLNDQDEGNVEGVASKRITMSFFTHANSNQLPIRKIVADWGDGAGTTPSLWPTDSQSGSKASDNFYKNHRGLSADGKDICNGAENDDFGVSTEACSSSFVVFNHDYVCSSFEVNRLKTQGRTCELTADGRLKNSPCTGGPISGAQDSCVFQPRVHVLDNWGWCTGKCDKGPDGTDGCFDSGTPQTNECNVTQCPSDAGGGSSCGDALGGVVNPWVNYDGYVIIRPE